MIELSDDNDDVFEEEEWHRYAESDRDLSRLRRMNNEEREETLCSRWDRALLRLSWLEQGYVTEDELSSFERIVREEDHMGYGPPVFPQDPSSEEEEGEIKEEKVRPPVVGNEPSLSSEGNPLLSSAVSPSCHGGLGCCGGNGCFPLPP